MKIFLFTEDFTDCFVVVVVVVVVNKKRNNDDDNNCISVTAATRKCRTSEWKIMPEVKRPSDFCKFVTPWFSTLSLRVLWHEGCKRPTYNTVKWFPSRNWLKCSTQRKTDSVLWTYHLFTAPIDQNSWLCRLLESEICRWKPYSVGGAGIYSRTALRQSVEHMHLITKNFPKVLVITIK